ncbi:MAG: extracellular solute-binding protein [Armatimonadia bacterium]
MRRIWLLMAGGLLVCCAGCAVRPTGADRPLRFAFWALNPAEVTLTQELVREFEAANPDLKVEILEIPSGYYEKLATMFAGGTPPDVMVLNHGRLRDFAQRRVLADLAKESAGVEAVRLEDGYCPAWLIEWNPTNLLLYDPEALAEAGVGLPPEEGWTWREFEAACRALKAGLGEGKRAASVCLYPYAAMAWLYQGGVDMAAARSEGLGAVLRDQRSLRGVEYLLRLAREGLIMRPDPAQDSSMEDFRAGRVAMTFVTPYSLGMLKKGSSRPWRLAGPLRDRGTATGCLPTAVAMAGSCAIQRGALRFLRVYATEGSRRRTAAGFCVPAAKELQKGEALEQGFGAQAAEVLGLAVERAEPYPVPVEGAYLSYEQSSGILRKALERVFSGGMEPQKALKEAAAELEAALPRQQAGG